MKEVDTSWTSEPACHLIHGHVIDVLKRLPDKSVHLILTSPPFYCLRSYGTDPVIWEGDLPLCEGEHEWVSSRYYSATTSGGAGSSREAFSKPGPENAARIKAARWHQDDTCSKCGAWRGELGSEPTPELFVPHIVQVFRAARRVLRDDGLLVLNFGDSYSGSWGNQGRKETRGKQRPINGPIIQSFEGYANFGSNTGTIRQAGLKNKDLIGIPFEVAFGLRADGWYLRSIIPWVKPGNAMPESVTDRPSSAVEYMLMFSKSQDYYYDSEAVKVRSIADHPSGNGFKRDARLSYRDKDGARGNDEQWTLKPSRNRRNSDAFIESCRLIANKGQGLLQNEDGEPIAIAVNPRPYKAAHFATWPTSLVEPFILAGTSEKACGECQAPWERIVDKRKGDCEAQYRRKRTAGMDSPTSTLSLSGNGSEEWAKRGSAVATLGWRPTCPHYDPLYSKLPRTKNARKLYQQDAADRWFERARQRPGSEDWETVPCAVLDPFCGSGATGECAQEHGRRFIGIDAKKEYLDELAAVRIKAGREKWVQRQGGVLFAPTVEPRQERPIEQMSLFAGVE